MYQLSTGSVRGFVAFVSGDGERFEVTSCALAVVVLLVGLGLGNGGFFPQAWGWASFALVWLLAMAVLVGTRIDLTQLEVMLLASLTALVVWTCASATWSVDGSQSIREAERVLLYLVAVVLVLVLARERSVAVVLGGVLVAVTCVTGYALVRFLFFSGRFLPSRFEGYLLFRPVGYANALGVLAVVGVLLALGFVLHARQGAVRTACTAALVPLLVVLYLTSSRGAWFALALGTLALLAAERERLRLLAVLFVASLGPLFALLLTWHAHLQADTPRFQAQSAVRLGLAVLLLTSLTALLAQPALALSQRLACVRWAKTVLATLLAVVILGVGGMLSVRADMGGAPFDVGSGERTAYWRVAWKEWQTNPSLGTGAGTFVHYWRAEKGATGARDAHNLYVETLAELGPPGLCLLLGVLTLPLLAARRARYEPLAPAALAAYLAYLVHASLDWDWEMPVVTLSALFCASALLVAARKGGRSALTLQTRAWMLIPLTLVLGVTAAELVANGAIR